MTHGEIWRIDFGIPVGSLPSKKKVSKLSEENYQKLVNAVVELIENK